MRKEISTPVSTVSRCFFVFLLGIVSLSAAGTAAAQKESRPASKHPYYEFVLSPEMNTGGPAADYYSRREIESFLCVSVPEFISLADVYIERGRLTPRAVGEGRWYIKKGGVYNRFYTRYKTVTPEQRHLLESHEINKWFEEKVTLVCTGYPSSVDIELVRHLLDTVNRAVGREKFVYVEGEDVGNLVVEFSSEPAPTDPMEFIGESACLQDKLQVVFYRQNDKMKIETYNTDFGGVDSNALFIKYTAREKEFAKKNRILKIHISDIEERKSRDMLIIHEILHSLGYCGHSPYADSNLFPLPIPVADLRFSSEASPLPLNVKITKTALRMLEMLYRPEILPGMSIKEAGEVLSRLKTREKTTPDEIKSFLMAQKTKLEKKKKALLGQARPRTIRREAIHREFYRLDAKKAKLLKEVRKENKLDKSLVKGKSMSVILRLNIGLAGGQLKRLEAQAKELKGRKDVGRKPQIMARRIFLKKEDLEVLGEILDEVLDYETQTRKLKHEERVMDIVDTSINMRLRRIVRKLTAVESEMARL